MTAKLLLIATLSLTLVATAAAQHGQGSRGGQQSQGRGSMAGQQQSTMGQQAGQGQMNRQKVQANNQQRQQLQTCTESTERLRNRIRQMARISVKQPLTADQAKLWREQLQQEMQQMTQDQEQLNTSLTEEQKTATKEETKTIQDTTEKLDQLADAVEMELALENPDPEKVKETAKKMESEINRIRSEQKKMQSVLTE